LISSLRKRVDSLLGIYVPGEFRRIAGNFGWLYFEQASRVLISLVVGALTARYLGPDKIGAFNFIATIVTFGGTFVGLNLDFLSVRELSQHPEAAPRILGTVFGIRILAAAFALAGTLLAVTLLQPGDRQAMSLALLMGPSLFSQSFLSIDIWFQSQYKSRLTVTSRLSGALGANALRLVLIYVHAPLTAFAAVYLAESVLTITALLYVYQRNGGSLRSWTFDLGFAKVSLRPVIVLLLTSVAVQLQHRLDIVLLQQFKGIHVVGLYTSALNLVDLAASPTMLFVISIAPLVANASSKGSTELLAALALAYKLVGFYCWVVGAGLAIFSSAIIQLFYGTGFAEAGTLLVLLSSRVILIGFGTVRSLFILNTRIYWFSLFSAVTGLIINVPLALLLIPRLGAQGAICSSFVSLAYTTFGAALFWRQTRSNLWQMLSGLFSPWRLRVTEIREVARTGAHDF
jgi:O-antigen/teichoic acid export membrane protein